MTVRRIASVEPFSFSADFSAPQQDTGERVTLSLRELAALFAEARAEGAREAADRAGPAGLERLERAAARLDLALADLSHLAERLDAAGMAGTLPEGLAAFARTAAQRVSDGQLDLFASCKPLPATFADSD